MDNDSGDRRRSTDIEITALKTKMQQLADNDEHLTNSINQLREDMQIGFRNLNNAAKPQWSIYLMVLGMGAALYVFTTSLLIAPLNQTSIKLENQVRELTTKTDTHISDGHPGFVVNNMKGLVQHTDDRLDAIEKVQEIESEHLRRWIKRIDEQGSIVHYGPKSRSK